MKKKDLITLLAGVAVIVFLAVFFMRGDQLQHLIQTIERGTPVFLLAGLVFQLGKYFTQGLSFTWCFKAAGTSIPIGENVILVFQTFFMDTIIPSFNISGTSVVIEAATKRGIESGRATGAALLRQVSISAAFVIIMIIGFAILLVMGKLETGWLILGIGAVVAVGAIVAAMALAALHPQFLLKIIAPIEHAIDKVLARLHRHDIDTSVKKLVDTYSSSAKDMVHNVPSIVIELAWAVVANICEIICFAFVGLFLNIVDSLVKPLLTVISLPLTIITLGIFQLVVNSFMLELASYLSVNLLGAGISIAGFGSAFMGSILVSIMRSILDSIARN